MVDAVVSFTIEKLNEFVTKQVSIRTGVKDELGYLLISVRAAEAHQDNDQVRLWTASVRDVANQALVILERFSAQQEEHAAAEQGGVLDRLRRFICICHKEANLFDIGKEIEALKEKIIGIKNRRDEYHINDIIMAAPTVQRRRRTLLRAASFEHEQDLIGFEDVVRTLLAQLGNGDPSLGLISIHGMGGLGKSTLASKLYHSTQLSHFKSRAWVCVSEDYDITHVLKKIINSVTGQELDSLNKMEEIELLRHLRTKLDGDHYLVVIDDIWDVEVWEKIKYAFPDKKNGSRVIITTRSKIVADGVDDACFVHQLRFLSEEESWELFCKRAKPTLNLEILGKEMVGKCGGLPLAIVILSGLLLQKKTYTFWSDVKDSLWRKLTNESLLIEEILNLSYDELSSPMRQCFLYLARFPEDYIIEVFNLKLLWIAEEFISEVDEEDGVVMEDVAEDYVNELANRNMIQIQLLSPEGQVLKCQVHDLVRALAIEKAREHKILGIFDSSKQHPNPIRLLQGQSRHVVYNGIGEYLKLLGRNSDVSMLRSLAITKKGIVQPKVEQVKLMYTRSKYLKVLDLSSVKSCGWIPEEMGDLILLKYLGLMHTAGLGNSEPLVIPPSIGKLKKLQTLIGDGQYIFPKEICELKESRHLCTWFIKGKLNIGNNQTKLQSIHYISYVEWFQIDTINWTNLRILVITDSGEEEEEAGYNFESIANLTNLRTLFLFLPNHIPSTIQPLSSCKYLKRVIFEGKIKDPEELKFLPYSVTDLTLFNTDFRKDPMPTLRRLSNLTALYLFEVYKGDKMVCSADAFPCLQFFRVESHRNLRELQVDDGALPSLKAFRIEYCPLIEMDRIPHRVMSLPPGPDLHLYLYY